MTKSESNKLSVNPFFKKEGVQHVLFWLIYFGFNTIRWGSFFNDYQYSLQSNLVEFPIHISLVYFTLYYLLPRHIPSRPYIFVILLLSALLLMTFLRIILTYEFVTQDVWKESGVDVKKFNINYIIEVFLGELYIVGIMTAIKLTIDRVRFLRKTRELQKRNFETELAFLKSQIQPHFFFNTLNNLYALTLEKSDLAPVTVLKLSELMKYVLNESNRKRVYLSSEIEQIKNYLDLEKLRFGERLDISFQINGEIQHQKVAPMILLPFIENGFKNGVTGKIGKIPLKIELTLKNHELLFIVENEKNNLINGLEIEDLNDKYGIGLENTKKRLELIYNNDYHLNINESDELYSITLKLPVHYDKMFDS